MPPNNTYVNFERFSQVLEEIAATEEGLRELERNQHSCQEDVAALLSIYEEKEGWYKEENQSISTDLSHIRQELQRTQAQRRKCQEDTRQTMQNANTLKRKFGRLENRYELLAEQVASEVRWVEELLKSISAEDGLGSGSMPWAGRRPAVTFSLVFRPSAWFMCVIMERFAVLPSRGRCVKTIPTQEASFLCFYKLIYRFRCLFFVFFNHNSTIISVCVG